MLGKFEIREGTTKIEIRGDRNNEFISAYQNLPKEFREELDKVLSVTLFDGYNLSIAESCCITDVLDTVEARTKHMINWREKNIREFENTLEGKNKKYQKYMNDETFLNNVRRSLEIERTCLKDLLAESL